MSYFYNAPENIYTVKVHTADCYVYEYTVKAKSPKEAQGVGYRKTFQYYDECGMRKEFFPTKITAQMEV